MLWIAAICGVAVSFRPISLEQTRNLSERLAKLYVPAVSDVLDDLGYPNQVLDPSIRPIFQDVKLVGPALTVESSWYSSFRQVSSLQQESLLSIFDDIYPSCVIVVAAKGHSDAATWGELLSNAARSKGAVGAVTDGAIRDVPKIMEITPPFQVFSKWLNPADAKGRVEFGKHNVPIICGGVRVSSGDLVFGDLDGVVIIPSEIAEKVVRMAEEKVEKESSFRSAVRRGEDLRKAVEKYGVI